MLSMLVRVSKLSSALTGLWNVVNTSNIVRFLVSSLRSAIKSFSETVVKAYMNWLTAVPPAFVFLATIYSYSSSAFLNRRDTAVLLSAAFTNSVPFQVIGAKRLPVNGSPANLPSIVIVKPVFSKKYKSLAVNVYNPDLYRPK